MMEIPQRYILPIEGIDNGRYFKVLDQIGLAISSKYEDAKTAMDERCWILPIDNNGNMRSKK